MVLPSSSFSIPSLCFLRFLLFLADCLCLRHALCVMPSFLLLCAILVDLGSLLLSLSLLLLVVWALLQIGGVVSRFFRLAMALRRRAEAKAVDLSRYRQLSSPFEINPCNFSWCLDLMGLTFSRTLLHRFRWEWSACFISIYQNRRFLCHLPYFYLLISLFGRILKLLPEVPLLNLKIRCVTFLVLSLICRKGERAGKDLAYVSLAQVLMLSPMGMSDEISAYFCAHLRPVFVGAAVSSFLRTSLTSGTEARSAVMVAGRRISVAAALLCLRSRDRLIQGSNHAVMDSSFQDLFVLAEFNPSTSTPASRRSRAGAKRWQRRSSLLAWKRQKGPLCATYPGAFNTSSTSNLQEVGHGCNFYLPYGPVTIQVVRLMYPYFCGVRCMSFCTMYGSLMN